MIVGVDPGTTVGIAVVDLNGQVLKTESYRNTSMNKIISDLSYYSPAVIASDVTPSPSYVRKVSAAFKATLFVPPESLSVQEKKHLTSEHEVLNDHERDALAAAIKAFHVFLPKIKRAKKIAEENEEKIHRAALKQVRLSDVVDSFMTKKEKEKKDEVNKLRKELGIEKKRVNKLEEQLAQSRKKLFRAHQKIRKLKKRIPKPKPKKIEKKQVKKEKKDLSAEEVKKLFEEYRH